MSAPQGWPPGVPAPEVEGWERRAVAWLLDLCPPGYRSEPLLVRRPLLLARITHIQVSATLEALRTGYSRARVELRDLLEPQQIDEAIAFYEQQGSDCARTLKSVELVEAALRGQRFAPKL